MKRKYVTFAKSSCINVFSLIKGNIRRNQTTQALLGHCFSDISLPNHRNRMTMQERKKCHMQALLSTSKSPKALGRVYLIWTGWQGPLWSEGRQGMRWSTKFLGSHSCKTAQDKNPQQDLHEELVTFPCLIPIGVFLVGNWQGALKTMVMWLLLTMAMEQCWSRHFKKFKSALS